MSWKGRSSLLLYFSLSALILLLLLPYTERFHFWPVTTDAALWVAKGAMDAPEWLRWDLLGPHFIGYRPLTALSFSLDWLLGGLEPEVYRATDLALHAGNCLLVFVLYRVLAGPRWPLMGLVAVLLFGAHPAVEEAVPMLARRSYLLCTIFGSASVLAFARGAVAEHWYSGWNWLSGLFLCASMLSNEAGYALLMLLPMLAMYFSGFRGFRRRFLHVVLPWLLGAMAIASRLLATGQVGGYSHMGPSISKIPTVVRQAGEYLFLPCSGSEHATLVLGGTLGLLLMAAYYLWRILGAFGAKPSPGNGAGWLAALLAGWVAAFLLLYALSGSWYPREAYPVLVPISLGFAVVLGDTISFLGRKSVFSFLHLLPQLVLAVALTYRSPVLRGPDRLRTETTQRYQDRLRAMARDFQTIQEHSLVLLVVPVDRAHRKSNSRTRNIRYQERRSAVWMETLFRNVDLDTQILAFVMMGDEPGRFLVHHLVHDGKPSLVFHDGVKVVLPKGRSLTLEGSHRVMDLSPAKKRRNRHRYLYYFVGSQGVLVDLGA